MTSVMIPARDIVAGVRAAFGGSDPCHCHTVPKLGEVEVLTSLVEQEVLSLADIQGVNAITIERLHRTRHEGGLDKLTHHAWRILRGRGIKYLSDLQEFTFTDLLALPDMKMSVARSIEKLMAEFGLLLKDGDPALLQAVREDKQKDGPLLAPPSDKSPEEIRITTARALIELGATMMRDGASLANAAAKIAVGGPRVAAAINRYITEHHKKAIYDDVARIAAPFLALAAMEKEPRQSSRKGTADTEEPVPQIEHLRNVVTGVFAEATNG